MAAVQIFHRVICLSVSLLCLQPLVVAQTPATTLTEAIQLNQQVVKLFNEGKFDEALPLAKRAAELAEKTGPTEPERQVQAANIIRNLAEIYMKKRAYPEADWAYSKSLRLYEKAYGTTDPRLCEMLYSYGWALYAKGDTGGAEKAFQRLVTLREKSVGVDHPDFAAALNTLAACYEKQGKTDKALPLLQRALAIREAKLQPHDPELQDTRKRLACAFYTQNRVMEAGGQWLRAGIFAPSLANLPGQVLQGYATHKHQPSYPPAARTARMEGAVIVHVIIDERGMVTEATRLCGPDFLAAESLDAAKRWRFKPTEVSGQPVKVQGLLTFNFSLR
jgi:TonB family protein